jgi:hypothetical protein
MPANAPAAAAPAIAAIVSQRRLLPLRSAADRRGLADSDTYCETTVPARTWFFTAVTRIW